MALSDLLGPALQIGSTILNVGNYLARANATQAIAKRRQAASAFEAEQLKQAAQEVTGVGMRAAQNQVRNAQLVNSAALARAAAGGGGASDPTVAAILGRTGAEGAYRANLALFAGQSQARLNMMRAAAAQYEGQTSVSDAAAAARALRMGAANTVLTAGIKDMTMYERFFPKGTVNAAGLSGGSVGSEWSDAGTQTPEDYT